MSNDRIGPESRVTLHFSLRLADVEPDGEGEVAELENTFDDEPAQLVIGDGSLLPGFERRLLGLKAGDRERFHMLPVDGFGHPRPDNVQRVPRRDRKSTRLNSSHVAISYAVFCLKKKKSVRKTRTTSSS